MLVRREEVNLTAIYTGDLHYMLSNKPAVRHCPVRTTSIVHVAYARSLRETEINRKIRQPTAY